MNRREFLSSSAAGLAATALPPLAAANLRTEAANTVFVHVFLRGGMDALSLLAPVDSAEFLSARPEGMRLEQGRRTDLSTQLDFRLAKSAEPVWDLVNNQSLSFVFGVGHNSKTRSHFQSQQLMDQGMAWPQNDPSGWLTRARKTLPASLKSPNEVGFIPFQGNVISKYGRSSDAACIHAGGIPPMSWYGERELLGLGDGGGSLLTEEHRFALFHADVFTAPTPFSAAIGNMFAFEPLPEASADMVQRAGYPAGTFGTQMQRIARYVRGDVGLRIATIDFGGWDTHETQDYFVNLQLAQLAKGLAAFWNDLGPYAARVRLVVTSEFGRRVQVNSNRGTDHGRGTWALVLGNNRPKSLYLNGFTGLQNAQLENGDLPVLMDYRQFLAENVAAQFPDSALGSVFPDFAMRERVLV